MADVNSINAEEEGHLLAEASAIFRAIVKLADDIDDAGENTERFTIALRALGEKGDRLIDTVLEREDDDEVGKGDMPRLSVRT